MGKAAGAKAMRWEISSGLQRLERWEWGEKVSLEPVAKSLS